MLITGVNSRKKKGGGTKKFLKILGSRGADIGCHPAPSDWRPLQFLSEPREANGHTRTSPVPESRNQGQDPAHRIKSGGAKSHPNGGFE